MKKFLLGFGIGLLFAALSVANACILVWIKKAFGGELEG